jgi:O-antigen/teichoic acid export membrane protein
MASAMRRDFLGTFGGAIVQMICLLGVQVVLARALGADSRGAFAACWTYMGLLQIVVGLGCDVAVTYHVAAGRLSLSRGLGICMYLGAAGLLLAVGLGSAASQLPLAYFKQASTGQFVAASVAAGAWLGYTYVLALLRGNLSYRIMNLATAFTPVLTAVFSVAFCIVFRFGVDGAIWAGTLAPLLTVAWVVWRLRKDVHAAEVMASYRELGLVLSYGTRAFTANLAQSMNFQSGIFVAGFCLSRADLGFFAIAMALVSKIWVVPDSLYQVVMPRMAQHGADEPEGVGRPFRFVVWAVVGASLVFAGVCWPLVYLAFGREYLPLVPICQWLLVGVIFRSTTKVLAAYFLASDRPGLHSGLRLAGLAINIAVLVVLVPRYGLIGTAIGTSISFTVEALMFFAAFRRVAPRTFGAQLVPRWRDLSDMRRIAMDVAGGIRNAEVRHV